MPTLDRRNSLHERGEMFQMQAPSDIAKPDLPHIGIERERRAQLAQRRIRVGAPADHLEPLTGAAHREEMSTEAEQKVVREDVRARHPDNRPRRDEAEEIYHEPAPVPDVVYAELLHERGPRFALGQVLRVDERRRLTAA